jgi:hypothetical protein
MDWSALAAGLIGAGIPAVLTYVGLRRTRQSADAEALGPAVLLLDHINPVRVTVNVNRDATAEDAKWAELQRQLDTARERLLVVSAGNPRRHVRVLAQVAEVKLTTAYNASGWALRDQHAKGGDPEWMKHAQETHAEAEAAMQDLISANFSWSVFRRPLTRPKKAIRPPAADLGPHPLALTCPGGLTDGDRWDPAARWDLR